MTIPQYAKTTHPDVLAAIDRNRAGFQIFHQRACAFSADQGVEKGAYYPSSFGGTHHVQALGGDVKPTTGRWTTGYGGYGWRPFKNNPLAAEMESIRFSEEAVPGLPSLVRGPSNRDLSHVIATPQPFVIDGTAYVGFSFVPRDEEGVNDVDHEPLGWVEILASEYVTAVEAYNARAKESKSDD